MLLATAFEPLIADVAERAANRGQGGSRTGSPRSRETITLAGFTPLQTVQRSARHGVTLIELLISVALTLLVILAIVRVFDLLGGNVTESRSILELSAQLRSASQRLQSDLDQLTLRPHPPANPDSSMGYLELIEGIRSDRDNDGDFIIDTDRMSDVEPNQFIVKPLSDTDLTGGAAEPIDITDLGFLHQVRGMLGDTDDVVMFTARSTGAPFRGRYNGQLIESPLAEIAWWLEPVSGPLGPLSNAVELALVRRVLVIRPDVPIIDPSTNQELVATPASLRFFLEFNDVSVRPFFGPSLADPSKVGVFVRANRLADLGTRQNRFAHWPVAGFSANPIVSFPDRVNRFYLVRTARLVNGVKVPELSDVVATDVMAFDLRVFDRLALSLRPTPTAAYAVTPVDPGFAALAAATLPTISTTAGTALFSLGAYVDLGYNVNAGGFYVPGLTSQFSGLPAFKSQIAVVGGNISPRAPRVYDTWSTRYESDGWDQDRNGLPDQGTNGLMVEPTDYVVDDQTEQETQPPYTEPLSGIEVLLRLREASSQQVRQASVIADFDAP